MAIGAAWGEIWADVWADVWVQSSGYPSLPIDNNSRRTTVSLGVTDYTASGIVRQRDFSAVDLYEFDVVHTLLTRAEAESIQSNWSSNKILSQTFDWIDGNTYNIRFAAPPVLQHMTGPYWSTTVKLVGTLA